MDDEVESKFSTHAEFEAHLLNCIGASSHSLQMFDPDFAVFPLGSSVFDAALRRFLDGGGSIRMVMHQSEHIAHNYPRFMRILQDFSHVLECRTTHKSIRHLTDSFCVGDGVNVVRRFHSDHMRGAAACDAPLAAKLPVERFEAMWLESDPGLHSTVLGL